MSLFELFDPEPKTHARRTDPDTSKDAAASLEPQAIGKRCIELLDLIRAAGDQGRTVGELVYITGYDRGNTARRITDLKQRGHIANSGRRRPAPSGRNQIVWVAI